MLEIGVAPSLENVKYSRDVGKLTIVVRFPLNGYQYPNIGTVSLYDFNYVW